MAEDDVLEVEVVVVAGIFVNELVDSCLTGVGWEGYFFRARL